MNRTLNSKSFLNPVILQNETAEKISRFIKESNLNVRELQNLFGFEQPQAIYNWKEGKSLPSLDNCVKLAHFLHTTVDNILVVDLRENNAEDDVPDEFRIAE